MWGDAYSGGTSLASERPRYGGLNLTNYADGACPRFGSCHLRLRVQALAWCSFTFGDSTGAPDDVGAARVFEPIVAGLLEAVERTGTMLGRPTVGTEDATELLIATVRSGIFDDGQLGRSLDDYVEAQIHGPVELGRDVDAIVIDPSFASTNTGHVLESLSERYGPSVHWHANLEWPPVTCPQIPRRSVAAIRPTGRRPPWKRGVPRCRDHRPSSGIRRDRPRRLGRMGQHRRRAAEVKYLWHTVIVYG